MTATFRCSATSVGLRKRPPVMIDCSRCWWSGWTARTSKLEVSPCQATVSVPRMKKREVMCSTPFTPSRMVS